MNREQFIEAVKDLLRNAGDVEALKAKDLYPDWEPGLALVQGTRILYGGKLYAVLQSHYSQPDWTPETAPSLFAEVLIPDPEVIPDWVQPESTNPYSKGDKVRHAGKIWVSDIDNNIWEPGVYGWTEVQA